MKLYDYLSRYELDIFRFPSDFISYKNSQWERIQTAYERGNLEKLITTAINQIEMNERFEVVKEDKKSLFLSMKQLFKKKQDTDEQEQSQEESNHSKNNVELFDSNQMLSLIDPTIKDLDEVKKQFLEYLFKRQINWATKSEIFVDDAVYDDEILKYFLQRFPDTHLLLYKPVFLVKTAPVSVDIVLLSPTSAWCITILEEQNDVFQGASGRFWIHHTANGQKKVLSPILGLNRMEKVVEQIFKAHDVDLPINKVVLNRTGFLDYPFPPSDIELVDIRSYERWYAKLKNNPFPLKHSQLKAAEALLSSCQTGYVKRVHNESPS
ncbi:NERD domain-containing protein [Cytobacillus suaedae]|nr:NERD domain-containing protein [Cytobacillus suaedae]